MNIIGIDPGKNGGVSLYYEDLKTVCAEGISDKTEKEVCKILREIKSLGECKAYIEKVHAAPGQGVVSMFSFGQNYGFWKGLLTALEISYEEVPPQTWQAFLGINTRGKGTYSERKRLLKQRAEQLYPNVSITLHTADAILISEYGKRINRLY